ncbi:MAG: sulfate ABC transporter permease subunit CysW [Oligoflexus sp.]
MQYVLPTLLTVIALSFFVVMLLLPLLAIFVEGLRKGWTAYQAALIDPDAWAALRLSLFIVVLAIPLNTIFGLSAAWSISKFRFPGKRWLLTLIDLPFAVSPVVAGLVFVLLFGSHGWWGEWLLDHGIQIIFAWPGILLATTFITLPFIVREILPLMDAQGSDQEEAAIILGASGWRTFWHVTLPNIRWALLHGIILCAARAMGEFGAVSVVSGHIRGLTNTLPLHVEILYNEYQFVAAFAVASLLALFSLVSLFVKTLLERKMQKDLLIEGETAI